MKFLFQQYLYSDCCYEKHMRIVENISTRKVITYDNLGLIKSIY